MPNHRFLDDLLESELLSLALRPGAGVEEEVRWSLGGFRARSKALAAV